MTAPLTETASGYAADALQLARLHDLSPDVADAVLSVAAQEICDKTSQTPEDLVYAIEAELEERDRENAGPIAEDAAHLPTGRPRRIQRRRIAGWRAPAGAVYVGRPTPWGNPFQVERYGDMAEWLGWCVHDPCANPLDTPVTYFATKPAAAEHAVQLYRAWLAGDRTPWNGQNALSIDQQTYSPTWVVENAGTLRGRDLMCWCPDDSPCHATVLLEVANASTQ